jgi:hypothetical protein
VVRVQQCYGVSIAVFRNLLFHIGRESGKLLRRLSKGVLPDSFSLREKVAAGRMRVEREVSRETKLNGTGFVSPL